MKAKDAVVKIDAELLERVEALIKEKKFVYSSKKQVINIAILEFLKSNSLKDNSRKIEVKNERTN